MDVYCNVCFATFGDLFSPPPQKKKTVARNRKKLRENLCK